MKKHFKKALTFAELTGTFIILAFISSVVIKSYSVNYEEAAKIKFKNAIVSFKIAMENLLTDPMYYQANEDLTDTSVIEVDEAIYSGNAKFRMLLMKELGIDTQGYFSCEILQGDKVAISNDCYKQDNGVVWGVPNSDFKTENLRKVENAQGGVSKYLPITIYSNYDIIEKNKKNYFERNALIIGVRRDGAITPITTVDCEKEVNKASLQCNSAEFFTSNKFRR